MILNIKILIILVSCYILSSVSADICYKDIDFKITPDELLAKRSSLPSDYFVKQQKKFTSFLKNPTYVGLAKESSRLIKKSDRLLHHWGPTLKRVLISGYSQSDNPTDLCWFAKYLDLWNSIENGDVSSDDTKCFIDIYNYLSERGFWLSVQKKLKDTGCSTENIPDQPRPSCYTVTTCNEEDRTYSFDDVWLEHVETAKDFNENDIVEDLVTVQTLSKSKNITDNYYAAIVLAYNAMYDFVLKANINNPRSIIEGIHVITLLEESFLSEISCDCKTLEADLLRQMQNYIQILPKIMKDLLDGAGKATKKGHLKLPVKPLHKLHVKFPI